ncbi:MAG: DUF6174 domain-containing protein [Acidimicrobiales bacterium]
MTRSGARPRGRARTMLMVGAPFVGILLFIGVTQTINIEDVGLNQALDRWEDNGPAAYEITYTYRGLGPATVVFDGTAVVDYSTGDPRLEDATIYWVKTLFDVVNEVEDDIGGDVLSVEFDPEWGYPLRASLDPESSEVGDEWSFEVLSLTAVDLTER